MQTKITIEKRPEGHYVIHTEYGSVTITKGDHINSTTNWLRYLPKKGSVEMTFKGALSCSKMLNMNPVQYRCHLSNHEGTRGYLDTGEFLTDEKTFNIAKKNGQKIMQSKSNRESYTWE
jgi:hypothetical protein